MDVPNRHTGTRSLPMDRLYRNLAGCGLAVSTLVRRPRAARARGPEVPPGPSFSGNGSQAPAGRVQLVAQPIAARRPAATGQRTASIRHPDPQQYAELRAGGQRRLRRAGLEPRRSRPRPTARAGKPGFASPDDRHPPDRGTGPAGPAAGIAARRRAQNAGRSHLGILKAQTRDMRGRSESQSGNPPVSGNRRGPLVSVGPAGDRLDFDPRPTSSTQIRRA